MRERLFRGAAARVRRRPLRQPLIRRAGAQRAFGIGVTLLIGFVSPLVDVSSAFAGPGFSAVQPVQQLALPATEQTPSEAPGGADATDGADTEGSADATDGAEATADATGTADAETGEQADPAAPEDSETDSEAPEAPRPPGGPEDPEAPAGDDEPAEGAADAGEGEAEEGSGEAERPGEDPEETEDSEETPEPEEPEEGLPVFDPVDMSLAPATSSFDPAVPSPAVGPTGGGVEVSMRVPDRLIGDIRDAVATPANVAILDAQGRVYIRGDRSYDASDTRCPNTGDFCEMPLPAGVEGFVKLYGDARGSGSASSFFALASDGALWAWGDNRAGQLGTGAGSSAAPAPVNLGLVDAGALPFVDIQVSPNGAAFALGRDARLYSWGEAGTIARDTTAERPAGAPALVDLGDLRFSDIAIGGNRDVATYALDSEGVAHRWVANRFVDAGFEQRFTDLAAGSTHVLGLADDGRLFSWGSQTSGELGDTRVSGSIARPQLVQSPLGYPAPTYTKIFAGQRSSFALSTARGWYNWGARGEIAAADSGNIVRAAPMSRAMTGDQLPLERVASGPGGAVGVSAADGRAYTWPASGAEGDRPRALDLTRGGTTVLFGYDGGSRALAAEVDAAFDPQTGEVGITTPDYGTFNALTYGPVARVVVRYGARLHVFDDAFTHLLATVERGAAPASGEVFTAGTDADRDGVAFELVFSNPHDEPVDLDYVDLQTGLADARVDEASIATSGADAGVEALAHEGTGVRVTGELPAHETVSVSWKSYRELFVIDEADGRLLDTEAGGAAHRIVSDWYPSGAVPAEACDPASESCSEHRAVNRYFEIQTRDSLGRDAHRVVSAGSGGAGDQARFRLVRADGVSKQEAVEQAGDQAWRAGEADENGLWRVGPMDPGERGRYWLVQDRARLGFAELEPVLLDIACDDATGHCGLITVLDDEGSPRDAVCPASAGDATPEGAACAQPGGFRAWVANDRVEPEVERTIRLVRDGEGGEVVPDSTFGPDEPLPQGGVVEVQVRFANPSRRHAIDFGAAPLAEALRGPGTTYVETPALPPYAYLGQSSRINTEQNTSYGLRVDDPAPSLSGPLALQRSCQSIGYYKPYSWSPTRESCAHYGQGNLQLRPSGVLQPGEESVLTYRLRVRGERIAIDAQGALSPAAGDRTLRFSLQRDRKVGADDTSDAYVCDEGDGKSLLCEQRRPANRFFEIQTRADGEGSALTPSGSPLVSAASGEPDAERVGQAEYRLVRADGPGGVSRDAAGTAEAWRAGTADANGTWLVGPMAPSEAGDYWLVQDRARIGFRELAEPVLLHLSCTEAGDCGAVTVQSEAGAPLTCPSAAGDLAPDGPACAQPGGFRVWVANDRVMPEVERAELQMLRVDGSGEPARPVAGETFADGEPLPANARFEVTMTLRNTTDRDVDLGADDWSISTREGSRLALPLMDYVLPGQAAGASGFSVAAVEGEPDAGTRVAGAVTDGYLGKAGSAARVSGVLAAGETVEVTYRFTTGGRLLITPQGETRDRWRLAHPMRWGAATAPADSCDGVGAPLYAACEQHDVVNRDVEIMARDALDASAQGIVGLEFALVPRVTESPALDQLLFSGITGRTGTSTSGEKGIVRFGPLIPSEAHDPDDPSEPRRYWLVQTLAKDSFQQQRGALKVALECRPDGSCGFATETSPQTPVVACPVDAGAPPAEGPICQTPGGHRAWVANAPLEPEVVRTMEFAADIAEFSAGDPIAPGDAVPAGAQVRVRLDFENVHPHDTLDLTKRDEDNTAPLQDRSYVDWPDDPGVVTTVLEATGEGLSADVLSTGSRKTRVQISGRLAPGETAGVEYTFQVDRAPISATGESQNLSDPEKWRLDPRTTTGGAGYPAACDLGDARVRVCEPGIDLLNRDLIVHARDSLEWSGARSLSGARFELFPVDGRGDADERGGPRWQQVETDANGELRLTDVVPGVDEGVYALRQTAAKGNFVRVHEDVMLRLSCEDGECGLAALAEPNTGLVDPAAGSCPAEPGRPAPGGVACVAPHGLRVWVSNPLYAPEVTRTVRLVDASGAPGQEMLPGDTIPAGAELEVELHVENRSHATVEFGDNLFGVPVNYYLFDWQERQLFPSGERCPAPDRSRTNYFFAPGSLEVDPASGLSASFQEAGGFGYRCPGTYPGSVKVAGTLGELGDATVTFRQAVDRRQQAADGSSPGAVYRERVGFGYDRAQRHYAPECGDGMTVVCDDHAIENFDAVVELRTDAFAGPALNGAEFELRKGSLDAPARWSGLTAASAGRTAGSGVLRLEDMRHEDVGDYFLVMTSPAEFHEQWETDAGELPGSVRVRLSCAYPEPGPEHTEDWPLACGFFEVADDLPAAPACGAAGDAHLACVRPGLHRLTTRAYFGGVTVEKTVADGQGRALQPSAHVTPRDELRYTVTFTNHGNNAARIDFTDDFSVAVKGGGRFLRWLPDAEHPDFQHRFVARQGATALSVASGVVPAGETRSFHYAVAAGTPSIEADGRVVDRGRTLENIVVKNGTARPADCAAAAQDETGLVACSEVRALARDYRVVLRESMEPGARPVSGSTFRLYPDGVDPSASPDAYIWERTTGADGSILIDGTVDPSVQQCNPTDPTGCFAQLVEHAPARGYDRIPYPIRVQISGNRQGDLGMLSVIRADGTPALCPAAGEAAPENTDACAPDHPEGGYQITVAAKLRTVDVVKSAQPIDPLDSRYAIAGEPIEYTLTFRNTGGVPSIVNHVDRMQGVTQHINAGCGSWNDCRDAGYRTGGPEDIRAGEGLSVENAGGGIMRITGVIPGGQQRTVTYRVPVHEAKINSYGELNPWDQSWVRPTLPFTFDNTLHQYDDEAASWRCDAPGASGKSACVRHTLVQRGFEIVQRDSVNWSAAGVAGSRFALVAAGAPEGSEPWRTGTTDARGVFKVDGVTPADAGLYELRQLEAPLGYERNPDPVAVRVSCTADGNCGALALPDFAACPTIYAAPSDARACLSSRGRFDSFRLVVAAQRAVVETTKTASIESEVAVNTGEDVTYTLTFANPGKDVAVIDHVDRMPGGGDRVDFLGIAPVEPVDDGAVRAVRDGNEVRITGALQSGEERTVRYTVRAKGQPIAADGSIPYPAWSIVNHLQTHGEPAPLFCLDGNPNCTETLMGHHDFVITLQDSLAHNARKLEGGYFQIYPKGVDVDDPEAEFTWDGTTNRLGELRISGVTPEQLGEYQVVLRHQPDTYEPVGEPVTVRVDMDLYTRNTGLLRKADTTRPEEYFCPTSLGDAIPAGEVCFGRGKGNGNFRMAVAVKKSTITAEKRAGVLVSGKWTPLEADAVVGAGSQITYRLTFTNESETARARVDHVDLMASIPEHAEFGRVGNRGGLTVTRYENKLSVYGYLDPRREGGDGHTATVEYTVVTKPKPIDRDGQVPPEPWFVDNFLTMRGTSAPPACTDDGEAEGRCTSHEAVNRDFVIAVQDRLARDGRPVVGARFEIYGPVDGDDPQLEKPSWTGTSDTNGEARLPYLRTAGSGTYVLRQTSVPMPFERYTGDIELHISCDENGGCGILDLPASEGQPSAGTVCARSGEPEPGGQACLAAEEGMRVVIKPLVGSVQVDKAVVDERGRAVPNGEPVTAGERLTYRLTFTNRGENGVLVDHVDRLREAPQRVGYPRVTDDGGLKTRVEREELAIAGVLPPGASRTVEYTATVARAPLDGAGELPSPSWSIDNFVTPRGEPVPESCPPAGGPESGGENGELDWACATHPVVTGDLVIRAQETLRSGGEGVPGAVFALVPADGSSAIPVRTGADGEVVIAVGEGRSSGVHEGEYTLVAQSIPAGYLPFGGPVGLEISCEAGSCGFVETVPQSICPAPGSQPGGERACTPREKSHKLVLGLEPAPVEARKTARVLDASAPVAEGLAAGRVVDGMRIEYTLEFENPGGNAALVRHIDHHAGLHPEGRFAEFTYRGGLTANYSSRNRLVTVSGVLPAHTKREVRYVVTVDHSGVGGRGELLPPARLENFVVRQGETRPAECTEVGEQAGACVRHETATREARFLVRTGLDAATDPVAGAEYRLLDAEGEVWRTLVSDARGGIRVDRIAPSDAGEYTLVQTAAPAGHVSIGAPVAVALSCQGETCGAVALPGAGDDRCSAAPADADACVPDGGPHGLVIRAREGLVDIAKTAAPAHGALVDAGQDIEYTLTFTNPETEAGTVSRVDHSDALEGYPSAVDFPRGIETECGLAATRPSSTAASLAIRGSVPAGESCSVTYTVSTHRFGIDDHGQLTGAGVAPPDGAAPAPLRWAANTLSGRGRTAQTQHPVRNTDFVVEMREGLDGESPAIAGAEFRLVRLDGADAGAVWRSGLVTNGDGEVRVGDVRPGDAGDYRLEQIAVPEGYGGARDVPLRVECTADGACGALLLPDRLGDAACPAPGESTARTACLPTEGGYRLRLAGTANHPDVVKSASVVALDGGAGETLLPGDSVYGGQTIEYRLAFTYAGEGLARIDHVDRLNDVLRHAVGPVDIREESGLGVQQGGSAVQNDRHLRITGTMKPGETRVVTYRVQVARIGFEIDGSLASRPTLTNFINRAADPAPAACDGDMLRDRSCTAHPVLNRDFELEVRETLDAGAQAVPGARFELRRDADDPQSAWRTVTSDENGRVRVADIAPSDAGPGSYTLVQTSEQQPGLKRLAPVSFDVACDQGGNCGVVTLTDDRNAENVCPVAGQPAPDGDACVAGHAGYRLVVAAGREPSTVLKSAAPAPHALAGDVVAGTGIDFTLTFTNSERQTARINYVDDLGEFLLPLGGAWSRESDVTVTNNGFFSVSESPVQRRYLTVRGTLEPGLSQDVEYTVGVRPAKIHADGTLEPLPTLNNIVYPDGGAPSVECDPEIFGDDGGCTTAHRVRNRDVEISVHTELRRPSAGAVPVEGAVFELQRKDGDEWRPGLDVWRTGLQTDGAGTVRVANIDPDDLREGGEFWIVQTGAALGHEPLRAPVAVALQCDVDTRPGHDGRAGDCGMVSLPETPTSVCAADGEAPTPPGEACVASYYGYRVVLANPPAAVDASKAVEHRDDGAAPRPTKEHQLVARGEAEYTLTFANPGRGTAVISYVDDLSALTGYLEEGAGEGSAGEGGSDAGCPVRVTGEGGLDVACEGDALVVTGRVPPADGATGEPSVRTVTYIAKTRSMDIDESGSLPDPAWELVNILTPAGAEPIEGCYAAEARTGLCTRTPVENHDFEVVVQDALNSDGTPIPNAFLEFRQLDPAAPDLAPRDLPVTWSGTTDGDGVLRVENVSRDQLRFTSDAGYRYGDFWLGQPDPDPASPFEPIDGHIKVRVSCDENGNCGVIVLPDADPRQDPVCPAPGNVVQNEPACVMRLDGFRFVVRNLRSQAIESKTAAVVSNPGADETVVPVGFDEPVAAGRTMEYALTFDASTNQGQASVDYTDHLADVLDDAAGGAGSGERAVVTDLRVFYTDANGVRTDDDAEHPADRRLTATLSGDELRVQGKVWARSVATVTYRVELQRLEIAPEDGSLRRLQSERVLENLLTRTGADPPEYCWDEQSSGRTPKCTRNPVVNRDFEVVLQDSLFRDGAPLAGGGLALYGPYDPASTPAAPSADEEPVAEWTTTEAEGATFRVRDAPGGDASYLLVQAGPPPHGFADLADAIRIDVGCEPNGDCAVVALPGLQDAETGGSQLCPNPGERPVPGNACVSGEAGHRVVVALDSQPADYAKSAALVDPAGGPAAPLGLGDPVPARATIEYTLAFENRAGGWARINHVDHLGGVLRGASGDELSAIDGGVAIELNGVPLAAARLDGREIGVVLAGDELAVVGVIQSGDRVTVRYLAETAQLPIGLDEAALDGRIPELADRTASNALTPKDARHPVACEAPLGGAGAGESAAGRSGSAVDDEGAPVGVCAQNPVVNRDFLIDVREGFEPGAAAVDGVELSLFERDPAGGDAPAAPVWRGVSGSDGATGGWRNLDVLPTTVDGEVGRVFWLTTDAPAGWDSLGVERAVPVRVSCTAQGDCGALELAHPQPGTAVCPVDPEDELPAGDACVAPGAFRGVVLAQRTPVQTAKSSDRADGSVPAGGDVRYALTFTNPGPKPLPIDHVDRLTGVPSAGEVVAEVEIEDRGGLEVVYDEAAHTIAVRGELPGADPSLPGSGVVTVTYRVRTERLPVDADGALPEPERRLVNALVGAGVEPVGAACVDGELLAPDGERLGVCTDHRLANQDFEVVVRESLAPGAPIVPDARWRLYDADPRDPANAGVAPLREIGPLTGQWRVEDVVDGAEYWIELAGLPDGFNPPAESVTRVLARCDAATGECGLVEMPGRLAAPDAEGDADGFDLCRADDAGADDRDACVAPGRHLLVVRATPAVVEHSKRAMPPSGTAVPAGDRVEYVLRFDNAQNRGAARVEHVDHLVDVLDDAALVEASIDADAGLEAVLSDGPSLAVTGLVPGGETREVRYSVEVERVRFTELGYLPSDPAAAGEAPVPGLSREPAAMLLRNDLTEAGESRPTGCVAPAPGADGAEARDTACTEHPVLNKDFEIAVQDRLAVRGERISGVELELRPGAGGGDGGAAVSADASPRWAGVTGLEERYGAGVLRARDVAPADDGRVFLLRVTAVPEGWRLPPADESVPVRVSCEAESGQCGLVLEPADVCPAEAEPGGEGVACALEGGYRLVVELERADDPDAGAGSNPEGAVDPELDPDAGSEVEAAAEADADADDGPATGSDASAGGAADAGGLGSAADADAAGAEAGASGSGADGDRDPGGGAPEPGTCEDPGAFGPDGRWYPEGCYDGAGGWHPDGLPDTGAARTALPWALAALAVGALLMLAAGSMRRREAARRPAP